MAGFSIETKLRPCYVQGEKGLFHGWFQQSTVVAPSPMISGAPGGTVAGPVGIVEFPDGSVSLFSPSSITFDDTGIFNDYAWSDNAENCEEGTSEARGEEEHTCDTCVYKFTSASAYPCDHCSVIHNNITDHWVESGSIKKGE